MKTRILSAVALTIILTLALGPVAHAQYTANFQTNTICCGGTMTSGDYVVGSNTYSDVLIFTMTEGSGLSDANGYLGYLAGSSNNVAIINIPESGWYNMGGNFYVGYSGSGNSVLITNGAFVITNYGVIGTNPGANRNAVTVTGGESVWENNASILIGDYGTSNTLTIATGAHVNDPIGQIGYESGANYNAVTVTSPGDFGYGWDNTGTLNVGTSGSGDTLTIADGGSVYDADGNIGLNSNGGSNNVVTVTGTNSVWNNSTNLAIGYAGSDNELVIANGGNVSSTTGFLGYNTDANGNGVTVTGVDSVWDNSGDIYIGYSGSGNSVIIAPGSSFLQGVDAVNGWIGYNTGANGNIISVSGTGSVWNSTGDVYVGNAGSSNTLTISDGGTVADAIGYIGYESGANYNLAEVALPGSVWNNSGAVTVGASGMNNELYISEGGVVFDTYGYIGYNTGTNENYVGVASGNSVWNNSADLYVGYSGSENELDIEPQDGLSQSVNNVNGWIGYNASANGNFVYVYLVASVWNNSGNLYVGNFGSGNELEISSGGVVSNNATAYIGSNAGANNNSVFVTEGALWKCNAPLYVGYGGSGSTLAIDDGGRVSDTYGNIGGAPGSESNAATVTGAGAVWNNTAGLSVGSSGSSSNTLTIANGGSLFVTNVAGNAALVVSSSAGPNTLSINGGSVTVNALIATNGLNSVVTFPAGTLASGGTSVSNTRLFAVGDGTDAATFQLNGGVHSFANNLEIRSNATLTGCGTIEGNVTVDPGGTMQTLCNPLAVNGIVTNNGTIIAANGDSIYFEGPVVNNGLIDAITGGMRRHVGGELAGRIWPCCFTGEGAIIRP